MSVSQVLENIETILTTEFYAHPFENIPANANYEALMRNYFAMSQAFPLLQAGSQKELVFHCMDNDIDMPESMELTSVVGNFLCWDETGGLYPTIAQGLKALPCLLETKRFHANLLRSDCEKIFGKAFKPNYSPITREYLKKLYNGLSSLDDVTRVAFMVSFESHAHKMIESLWLSLVKRFNLPKQKLVYFAMHVGGEDPAEKYHVEMTRMLIERTVAEEKFEDFYSMFTQAYQLHRHWCQQITQL